MYNTIIDINNKSYKFNLASFENVIDELNKIMKNDLKEHITYTGAIYFDGAVKCFMTSFEKDKMYKYDRFDSNDTYYTDGLNTYFTFTSNDYYNEFSFSFNRSGKSYFVEVEGNLEISEFTIRDNSISFNSGKLIVKNLISSKILSKENINSAIRENYYYMNNVNSVKVETFQYLLNITNFKKNINNLIYLKKRSLVFKIIDESSFISILEMFKNTIQYNKHTYVEYLNKMSYEDFSIYVDYMFDKIFKLERYVFITVLNKLLDNIIPVHYLKESHHKKLNEILCKYFDIIEKDFKSYELYSISNSPSHYLNNIYYDRYSDYSTSFIKSILQIKNLDPKLMFFCLTKLPVEDLCIFKDQNSDMIKGLMKYIDDNIDKTYLLNFKYIKDALCILNYKYFKSSGYKINYFDILSSLNFYTNHIIDIDDIDDELIKDIYNEIIKNNDNYMKLKILNLFSTNGESFVKIVFTSPKNNDNKIIQLAIDLINYFIDNNLIDYPLYKAFITKIVEEPKYKYFDINITNDEYRDDLLNLIKKIKNRIFNKEVFEGGN